ncbi:MAG TPA: DUF1343 domain-containing protein [Chitinophagaceae bacterium]|nr:DUF1343 domain-containing protein [Chitinophagaceae bacterium]
MNKVLFGVDTFLNQKKQFGQFRIGLVTNSAATTYNGQLSRVALLNAGFNITKLFSPEHGLNAKGEDGAYQKNSIDSFTQLPVISLYGNHLKPSSEELSAIDIVLFDIPDVGCRFYTYLWTMTYMMEACASHHIPFIILDRPNPVSGVLNKAEGPMLDEANCSSFTGRWNIPIRHSCTMGELGNYFAKTKVNNCNLTVIKVQNWKREQTVLDSGWNFIPTSPAIRDAETALLYPGMGLLEGINVNEGRGSNAPFKICGAPWIDAGLLNKAFSELKLPGIKAIAISYNPELGLYAGKICNGLKLSVTETHSFRPVETGVQLLHLISFLFPEQTTERLYPTIANPAGKGHLDKLTGIHHSFEKLMQGLIFSTETIDWEKTIHPYLLY